MARTRLFQGWRGITAATGAALLTALPVASATGTGRALAAGASSLPVTGMARAQMAQAQVAQYSAVFFLSAAQGWVGGSVGGEGVAWITGDGGRTWSQAVIGPVQPLAMDFATATDGFVIGQPIGDHCPSSGCPNVVFRTTNGGRTWGAVWSEPRADSAHLFLTAIDFTSPNAGYALGYTDSCRGGLSCNTHVYRTLNGGQTWRPLDLSGLVPTSIQFLDARHGYVGGFACADPGCRAAVLTTTDAGERWSARDLPLPPYPISVATVDVDFADPGHGWVLATPPEGVTMGGGFGPLLRTDDAGRTWREQQASFAWGDASPRAWAGFPSGLDFASRRVGWLAVGAGAGGGMGGVDVTTNGGRAWTRIGGRALWSITQVAAAGANQAWAVGGPKLGGPSFVMHLWSDGRARQVLPALAPDAAVALVGPDHAIGLGLPSAPGAVMLRQGGQTQWQLAAKLTGALLPTSLGAKRLPSGAVVAWAAAEVYGSTAWAIWQSSNGGRTWRQVNVARHAWMGVRFFNARDGVSVESGSFAGTSAAALATTHDGGHAWRAGPSVPVGSELMAASFASPAVGYVVTFDQGESVFSVWRTTDGGRRWRTLGTLPFGGGGPVLLDATGGGATWLLVNSDLYRSTDAGLSWTRTSLGPVGIRAMAFLGPDRGVLLLAGGGLLRTVDGGRVWSREP